MKSLSKLVAVLALLPLTAGKSQADSTAGIINLEAEELAWEVTREGVAFAPLRGNRFEDAYMAMVRLPSGLVSPPHVKTANMFGVVVSGTLTHTAVGAAPDSETRLGPGSYYKIPAGLGLGHVSKCISTIECVTFLYQDGKFDFLPVAGEGQSQ